MTVPDWADVAAAVRLVDPAEVAGARWFGGKGRPVDRIEAVEAFDLGSGAALALAEIGEQGAAAGRYVVPLVRRGATWIDQLRVSSMDVESRK